MSSAGPLDLLIDEAGEWWLNGSPLLRKRLGNPSPDIDLATYVVRNMGYARLRWQGSTIRIMVSAGRLEPKTLEAVVRFLLNENWQRLVIEHPDRMPGYEIYGLVEEAVARLKDLSVVSVALARRDRFFNQELSLARLQEDGHDALHALFRLWRSRRGQMTPNQIIGLMPRSLKPRMTLAKMTSPVGTAESRALVEHIGTGFRVFDPCWTLTVIGRDLEEQPDPVYGEQSARAYHEVAELGRPRLELVDAVIDVPGRPMRRSRYERLVVPLRSRGEIFVCGASVLRSSYVLEPAVAAATQAFRS